MKKVEAQNVFECLDDGERRCVSLLQSDEGIRIEERTEGPLTQSIYEEDSHVQQVLVRSETIPAAADQLGTTSEGLAQAMSAFFEVAPHRVLTDLMDFFDANDIPYDYRSWGSSMGCFRPGTEKKA